MDNNELDTLFLGKGWSFPTTFSKSNREVIMVKGQMDIEQSLEILLGTRVGERLLHPKFGCNLQTYLYQPLSTTTQTIIKDLVDTAIINFEPRINLDQVKIDTSRQTEGILLIELEYIIKTTNARSNYVFPFYLEEGTNT